MKLELPANYSIGYPERNDKYYDSPYSGLIRELLTQASQNYCMYCGRKLTIEGEDFSHLEHSVDKKGNIDQKEEDSSCLMHCKFNIALSCPKCNTVYKKKVIKINFERWKDKKCPENCTKMCDDYIEMRKEYMRQNQIVLQPHGYQFKGHNAVIEFNLLKFLYEPKSDIGESTLEFLLGNHIEKFDLNGSRFSESILDICEDVVDLYDSGILNSKKILDYLARKKPYDNLLGNLYIDFLKKYFYDNTDRLILFCKMELLLSIAY